MPRRIVLALLSVLVAAAGGCGSGPDLSDRPTDPTQLVLGIAVVHAADSTEQRLLSSPSSALFGDGRLFRPGPQVESYPGPALPSFTVVQLDDGAVEAILKAAAEAGLLGADQELRFPVVQDPAITVFVVFVAGQRHQTVVEALDEVEPDDPRLSGEAGRQRQAMKALVALMANPAAGLPGGVGPETAYEPVGLRILVSPAQAGGEPSPIAPAVRDWPLAVGLAEFGAALKDRPDARCGTIEGAEFATLFPLVRESNELTRWSSGGKTYELRFRPLLPGETGCGA